MRKGIFAFALTAAISIAAATAAFAAPGAATPSSATSTTASSSFATPSSATPAGSGRVGGGGGGGRNVRSSGGRVGTKGVWTKSASVQTGAGQWFVVNGRWWYRYTNGGYATNWAKLSFNGRTDWYFFDSNGWMQTGWLEDSTGKYYLNPIADGAQGRMITGTYTIDGVEHQFETQAGKMQGHLIR